MHDLSGERKFAFIKNLESRDCSWIETTKPCQISTSSQFGHFIIRAYSNCSTLSLPPMDDDTNLPTEGATLNFDWICPSRLCLRRYLIGVISSWNLASHAQLSSFSHFFLLFCFVLFFGILTTCWKFLKNFLKMSSISNFYSEIWDGWSFSPINLLLFLNYEQ